MADFDRAGSLWQLFELASSQNQCKLSLQKLNEIEQTKSCNLWLRKVNIEAYRDKNKTATVKARLI